MDRKKQIPKGDSRIVSRQFWGEMNFFTTEVKKFSEGSISTNLGDHRKRLNRRDFIIHFLASPLFDSNGCILQFNWTT